MLRYKILNKLYHFSKTKKSYILSNVLMQENDQEQPINFLLTSSKRLLLVAIILRLYLQIKKLLLTSCTRAQKLHKNYSNPALALYK